MSQPKVSIFDPKSGEEAYVAPAAFATLLESGIITETGAFAPEEVIEELGCSVWDVVRDALSEVEPF
jgi:hypothetical protein